MRHAHMRPQGVILKNHADIALFGRRTEPGTGNQALAKMQRALLRL